MTVAEARALKEAGELPDEYTLKDSVANTETAARDLYDGATAIVVVDSVANLTDDNDALVDIAGATYQIEDTLANIVAADDALVDGAGEYSLTDATDGLLLDGVAVGSDELAILAGAQNADDYGYTLEDTAANLKAADDALVAGAESVNITDVDDTELGGDDISVADAILIQKAGLDVDYTVKDTADNILAAEDALAGVAFTVSNADNVDDVSVEQATFLQNAENARDLTYNVAGTVAELTSDSGNLLSVVTGAANVNIVDNLANIAGASAGVLNAADEYTIEDTLANLAADDSGLVEDAVAGSGKGSLALTDGEDWETGDDAIDLGTLSVAAAAIVEAAGGLQNADGETVDYKLTIEGSFDELTHDDDDALSATQLKAVLEQEGASVTLVNDTVDGEVAGDENTRDSDMDLSEIGESVTLNEVVSDFSGLTANSESDSGYANYTKADASTTFTIANVGAQVASSDGSDANGFDLYKAGVNTGVSGDAAFQVNLVDNAEGSYYSATAKTSNFAINAEEGNSGAINLDGGSGSLDITVTGEGDLAFQSSSTYTIGSLDASESAGDIVVGGVDMTPSQDASLHIDQGATVTTGSGNDTIDLSGATFGSGSGSGTATVSTGAGNDTIKADLGLLSDSSLELAGGAGNDSFVLSNANEGAVTITDFFRGDNTLTLDGILGDADLVLGDSGATDANVTFVDDGADTTLTVGDSGMEITLTGVSGADLAVAGDDIVIA